MSQADLIPSGTAPSAPTGFFNQMSSPSRRSVLGGGVIALAAVSLPVMAGVQADARFWAAHARFTELEAAWEADADNSDENWDRWSELVEEAGDAMFLTPVETVQALAAKYKANRCGDRVLSGGRCASDVIATDLERLAARERQG